ncbi:GNAT family N-acetyltransferase [Saccharothrix sp. 6-C]|nr:GNAT family N-acetyltransferase [Saccharothrix sp. 6-C]
MITRPLLSRPAVGHDAAPPAGLTGRQVRLRAVVPADRHTLTGFDRAAARGGSPRVGGYRHWAAHRAVDAGGGVQFAIETLHSRILVGSLWTGQADPRSDRFSYGIGIGPQHRRCGYAADAITTLLAFMFDERGYGECEVGVHAGNTASLTLHGALGFREEDRPRDTELPRGWVDHVVRMSITAYEFAQLQPTLVAARPSRGRHWRPRRGRHWQVRL